MDGPGKVYLLNRKAKRERKPVVQARPYVSREKQLEHKVINLTQIIYALLLEQDDPTQPTRFNRETLQTIDPRLVSITIEPDPRVGTDGIERAQVVLKVVDPA